MVLIWSILISAAVSYVLTSMAGEPFDLTLSAVVAGIFFIAIILLGDVVLKEDKEHNSN